MAAPKTPPTYPFNFVMEYAGRLDPSIAKIFSPYNEPQRYTRDIELGGRRRPLVFLTERTSRDRAFRLRWKDRTDLFHEEYVRGDDGEWTRRDPLAPEPITEPDDRGLARRAESDPLDLPVKDLMRLARAGTLDGRLDELLRRESEADNNFGAARQGVLAALAQRREQVAAGRAAAPGAT